MTSDHAEHPGSARPAKPLSRRPDVTAAPASTPQAPEPGWSPTGAPARTPAKRKARQLVRHLRAERPDYAYLKEVFRHLRDELDIEVTKASQTLPYVPTEAEIRRYYDTVWTARRTGDIVLIKTLLYTGVRVAELVKIRIDDVDLDACRIRITQGKGGKDRYVPFPAAFKETLALHLAAARDKGAVFLFESSWKKPYSTRGVRAMLARYAAKANLDHNMPPHRLRHFLFTWLKVSRVASGASFDKICELALPATSPFGLDQGRLAYASSHTS